MVPNMTTVTMSCHLWPILLHNKHSADKCHVVVIYELLSVGKTTWAIVKCLV